MAVHAPITGAPTRASEINRRGLLAGLVLAPALAATPVAVARTAGHTPFARAVVANATAEKRFDHLPYDLQFTDPVTFDREEKRMLDTWRVLVHTPPANWSEFATKFAILTSDGDVSPTDEQSAVLMADVRRLRDFA